MVFVKINHFWFSASNTTDVYGCSLSKKKKENKTTYHYLSSSSKYMLSFLFIFKQSFLTLQPMTEVISIAPESDEFTGN